MLQAIQFRGKQRRAAYGLTALFNSREFSTRAMQMGHYVKGRRAFDITDHNLLADLPELSAIAQGLPEHMYDALFVSETDRQYRDLRDFPLYRGEIIDQDFVDYLKSVGIGVLFEDHIYFDFGYCII